MAVEDSWTYPIVDGERIVSAVDRLSQQVKSFKPQWHVRRSEAEIQRAELTARAELLPWELLDFKSFENRRWTSSDAWALVTELVGRLELPLSWSAENTAEVVHAEGLRWSFQGGGVSAYFRRGVKRIPTTSRCPSAGLQVLQPAVRGELTLTMELEEDVELEVTRKFAEDLADTMGIPRPEVES